MSFFDDLEMSGLALISPFSGAAKQRMLGLAEVQKQREKGYETLREAQKMRRELDGPTPT